MPKRLFELFPNSAQDRLTITLDRQLSGGLAPAVYVIKLRSQDQGEAGQKIQPMKFIKQ
ncbi:MAG: hypothetical protein AAF587_25845 [Bacteroidota bacterium]